MQVCGGVAFRPSGVAFRLSGVAFRPRAGTHNNTSHAFDNHAAKSIETGRRLMPVGAGRRLMPVWGSGMEGVVEDIDAGDYEFLA